MRVRAPLVLVAALAVAGVAVAQGALVDGIVTASGGLCLDFEGSWDHAHPPPDGTPVVLDVCNGADDQHCGPDGPDDPAFQRLLLAVFFTVSSASF